jgi:hypothetical protein
LTSAIAAAVETAAVADAVIVTVAEVDQADHVQAAGAATLAETARDAGQTSLLAIVESNAFETPLASCRRGFLLRNLSQVVFARG